MNAESRSFHVATLASLAVAQPLLDLLGRSPEFLLAHDLGRLEILALVGLLAGVLPLGCALVIALLDRAHAGVARVAATMMVMLFASLVALYAVRDIPTRAAVVVSTAIAAGVGGGVLYHTSAVARSFTAWLTPGIVLVPLLFLLRPGVQSLVWPQQHAVPQSSTSTTPVVLVVFDGLPLTALLDANLNIDREHYPAFAALAEESTWYRNTTTVSDYTQWALPAILSGRYPAPRSLPIASDHPETIFTLLGGSHVIHVHEPITRLCPETLCDHGGEGFVSELTGAAGPLSTAYLHAVLPDDLADQLPPLDQGWAEGIPPSDTPGAVWLQGGEQSRRGQALAFVNAMADGPQPSLHFLHVLLPHTPLAYLPGGQRYGTERQ
ncbi:MAG TPA: hypothetical protein VFO48_10395, partial [Vicinamibacterales bacterium]|nr:hypothetical protein [Vicinamibacterales bacterium]